ncbi:replicative DNA helicase, partial [Methylobacterium soli]
PAAAPTAQPIADVDTEAGLIGCILTQPHVFSTVQHLIAAEQFFEPVHQVMWEAIGNVSAAGGTPDLLKVKRALGSRITEQDLGGKTVMAYLTKMAVEGAVPAAAEEYARTVQQLWQIRAIGEAAAKASDGTGFVPGSFLEHLYARVDQVRASFVDRKVRSASLAQAGDALMARIEASLKGEARELPRSGIVALDEELGGGLAPSSLITGGARTSMGKSVWGVEVSRHVARDGAAAIYHSLEMPSEQVVARLAASRLLDLGREIPFSRIMKRRGATSDDANAVAGALHDVRNYPLTIEDGGGRTIGDIAAASDRLANAYARRGIPLGVIVIDHAHIVRPSRAFKREDEGFKEVADGALALAKHLDTCVLLLAQLNRGTEGRDDKRPSLADLRGAGAFEEDSDAVIFLYRPAYYLERSAAFRNGEPAALDEHRACRHELEFIIDKNRAGRSNQVVRAWIDPGLNAIRNLQFGA